MKENWVLFSQMGELRDKVVSSIQDLTIEELDYMYGKFGDLYTTLKELGEPECNKYQDLAIKIEVEYSRRHRELNGFGEYHPDNS